MKKHELILTVSKVKSRNGSFHFSIGTNLSFGAHAVNLPDDGKLPQTSPEDEILRQQITITLSTIFSSAKHHLNVTDAFSYKFIFSDKHIATGLVPVEGKRIESYTELTLPMLEDEAVLIFSCIPYNC